MAAKTLRNLVAGSGNVTTVSGSQYLSFANAQSFKAGATIQLSGGQVFTIQEGMGTTWTARQKASASVTQSFNTSDTGTGRGRGSSGVIVPWAIHTVYCSVVDDSGAGAFDYYCYVDTLIPEKGLHPYTRDPAIGALYATMAADTPSFLPDDRVRVLEGIVRGPNGTTFGNPDGRLVDHETRLSSLESWANSAGHFGTPPAVGSYESGTWDQLRQRGDA